MLKKTSKVIALLAAFLILPTLFIVGNALMPQKVYLHANGGEWKSTGEGGIYTHPLESDGSDMLAIPEYPERNGYIFKMFQKEVPEDLLPEEQGEDEKTLYAYWDELGEGESQLIYYLNDDSFRSQPLGKFERHSNHTVKAIPEVNTNWTVPLGKRFIGWSSAPEAEEGEEFYQPGEVVNLKARDNRLYARYEDVPFNLSFGMGEAPGLPPEGQQVLAGQLAENPGDPAWSQYIFDGWYEEGSNKPWDFELSPMPYKDVHLVARWSKEKQYTVKFNLNGAPGVEPEPQTMYAGEMIHEPALPHWDGFIFEGWYLLEASSSTDNWNFKKDYMPAYGITLFARWKRIDAPQVQPTAQVQQEQSPGQSQPTQAQPRKSSGKKSPLPPDFENKEVPGIPTDIPDEGKPSVLQMGIWEILANRK